MKQEIIISKKWYSGMPTGITSSAIGVKICAITAKIKKYKSIINKNEKKHDKIL